MEIDEWYNNKKVKELITPFIKRRESVIISKTDNRATIRYMNLFCPDSLKCLYKSTRFLDTEKECNLYSSLAKFKGYFPVRGFYGEKRRKDVAKIKDGENYAKSIISMDFALDIDAPDHTYIGEAFFNAKQIKRLFDNLDVPYSLRFSGCGFHFVIPAQYFKHNRSYDGYVEDNIYQVYRALADCLYNEFSEFIDTSIYDMKRVLKTPYSLAIYDPETVYVCWEYRSDEEFEDF